MLIVCLTTTIQRRTPGELQGRTFTAFELFAGVPQLLSIVAGAALVTLVDYRIPLLVMAVGIAAAGVYSALRLREDAPPVRARGPARRRRGRAGRCAPGRAAAGRG